MSGAPPTLVIQQDKDSMVPLEAETIESLLLIARHNIKLFDQKAFVSWLRTQSGTICALAKLRPPNKVYRLITDDEKAKGHGETVYAIVLGYVEATRGEPAMCMVQVLGIKEGAGSHATPMRLPAECLV